VDHELNIERIFKCCSVYLFHASFKINWILLFLVNILLEKTFFSNIDKDSIFEIAYFYFFYEGSWWEVSHKNNPIAIKISLLIIANNTLTNMSRKKIFRSFYRRNLKKNFMICFSSMIYIWRQLYANSNTGSDFFFSKHVALSYITLL
jgi:hypothetical protein